MKLKNIKYIAGALFGMTVLAGCDLEEKFYSEAEPSTFFTNAENVYSCLRNPFRHWQNMYNTQKYWILQELTTDEMCNPARAADYYDNGKWIRLHYHTWTAEEEQIVNTFNQINYIISHGLVTKESLAGVDYPSIGLTEQNKANHLAQVDVLLAYAYSRILDLWGGMPIYLSPNDEPKARNTDRECFDWIEQTIKKAIPNLEKRASLNQYQDGYLTEGAAVFILAQLYLNAEAYIGVDMYSEAEALLQELYDGKHGVYQLDPTWYGPHDFTNDQSPEAIWYIPSETGQLEFKSYKTRMWPYNSKDYFDCASMGKCYNGYAVAPSMEKPGKDYTFKLGRSFAKFNEKDLRKKPYFYKGNGEYEGMFMYGVLQNPRTGKKVVGTKLKKGEVIDLVDYCNITGEKSDMMAADENSLVRIVKTPIPNDADQLLLWNPDFPVLRFTEVVYNLAECKLHRGDAKGAAELINSVRKRNFENGADPDPCTAQNLDKYRLADEYLVEFIGEAHRRTDLIRWGFYNTEEWWDHQPTPATRAKFCIPNEALYANPQLEQNPGY